MKKINLANIVNHAILSI